MALEQTSDPKKEAEPRIEGIFRNGSLTVVGIILGFSLGFISDWASRPLVWEEVDILAVVPLIVGIGLQVKSFADLLSIRSLELAYYNKAKNIFLLGLFFVAIGVATAIITDLASMRPPA
ncbi:MAG: hypothetical protein PW790_10060 [Parvibaculaceae bacterium]|nr:hypothetical protein [Parvibaculaceae bacterium]